MRHLSIIPALALSLMLAAPTAAPAEELSSKQIKSLIGGKRVLLATAYGAFPLVYRSNGRVTGDGTGLGLAKYAAPKETGSWWVSGNKMCQKFPTWYRGKRQCFTLRKIGPNKLRWVRQDGFAGTARISG